MNQAHLWFNVSVFLQDILAGCKEALSLSPHSGFILERLSSSPQQKSSFPGSSSGDSSPGLSVAISASGSSTGSDPDITAKHSTLSAAWHLRAESEQASHDQSVFCFVFSVFWHVKGRVHIITFVRFVSGLWSLIVFGCWHSESKCTVYLNCVFVTTKSKMPF